MGWIPWLVGLVLTVFVIESTIVGFRGGRVPIFGDHVRGTTAHGMLWLFITGSFSFGIYVAVTVLTELLAKTTSSGSPRQPTATGG